MTVILDPGNDVNSFDATPKLWRLTAGQWKTKDVADVATIAGRDATIASDATTLATRTSERDSARNSLYVSGTYLSGQTWQTKDGTDVATIATRDATIVARNATIAADATALAAEVALYNAEVAAYNAIIPAALWSSGFASQGGQDGSGNNYSQSISVPYNGYYFVFGRCTAGEYSGWYNGNNNRFPPWLILLVNGGETNRSAFVGSGYHNMGDAQMGVGWGPQYAGAGTTFQLHSWYSNSDMGGSVTFVPTPANPH